MYEFIFYFLYFRVSAYLHAACPSLPCIPLKIPDAINAPNALLIMFPQYKIAVRSPSSSRLYHFESRNCIFQKSIILTQCVDTANERTNAPGKNAASTNPRKKRVRSAPVKL